MIDALARTFLLALEPLDLRAPGWTHIVGARVVFGLFFLIPMAFVALVVLVV